ncbi:MAG: HEAT repeat domain-containing protein [Myxococcota bacterium]|nr:HEAT repeat domain-containing protein [Myxococcota bacterium]
MHKRHVLTFGILIGLLAGTVSAQVVDDSHRHVVITLITAKNRFPTPKMLYRTGELSTTNRILMELAIDRQQPPRLRLNAIRALEYFPTKRTEEVLMTLLYTRRQVPAFQRACMRALARAFGVKMLYEIRPFLRDLDHRVRAGAAVALAEIDDGRIQNMLMNTLVSEEDITVRLAIERGLSMIESRNVARRPTAPPRALKR